MVNYKNSKIYTIRSHQTDLIYIGSTCNELRKRLYQHKAHYKSYLNGKRNYVTSFEIIKYDDAYIELYEKYPSNDKIELRKREGELIRELNCVNKRIPCRSKKEWEKNNREKIYKNRQKPERILKYNIWREKNKDIIKNNVHQYYIDNKHKIKQKRKEYREKNRDKIKQRITKIYNCDCGKTIQRCEKSRHNKSKYHRMNIHNIFNHL